MTKFYYIIIAAFGSALLIALFILSYVDRTVLYPSPATREATVSGSPVGTNTASVPKSDEPVQAHPPGTPEIVGAFDSPSLTLRLIGTTVFGDRSSAIIEDNARNTRGVYRLGDVITGFTITAIEKDLVTLTSGDRSFVLTRTSDTDQQAAGSFFTRLDDNSWLVSADKAEDMVSNIDQYVGQVIAFQHREHGEAAGFKIRHLKEGNDFEQLGIRNNDIIKRVNGLDVNDLTDVLTAVYQLSDETEFTIEVERGGRLQDLNYRLDRNVNALVPIITRMLNLPLAAIDNQ